MGLSEDHECGVCYERYSRSKHVPRVLFCNHTFCGPCLETMATQRSGMLSVRCPLCRQVSCVRRGLSLEEALWVNSRLWDHIQEAQELEVKEEDLEKECKEEKRKSDVAEAVSPVQPQCRLRPSPQHDRLRLRLPGFLRRMIVPRQSQERIVPGCNVRMKSWRRLSGEEMP
ncbi:E3 ubiquitin-protein ligase RNF183 isoform X1 [Tachysurus vachellii]|uniref:E3 ubiquitin-protein ligase RNF183 isoform X1 n=1 Tax=Tachysurus vachellii TaxID=175792 RepID=UPI00296A9F1B|nr:E3 ubiquitin-protein ligase RNF183 isoform X1 [Tachysurus vachellii]